MGGHIANEAWGLTATTINRDASDADLMGDYWLRRDRKKLVGTRNPAWLIDFVAYEGVEEKNLISILTKQSRGSKGDRGGYG